MPETSAIHPSVARFVEASRQGSRYLRELERVLSRPHVLARSERARAVLRVQAIALSAIWEFLDSHGFIELLPPILGTRHGSWDQGARQVVVDYYGWPYKVMSSAILYKQAAASALERIYFVSPHVGLEPPEAALTGQHLAESVQVDVEASGIGYEEAMGLAEGLLKHVVAVVKGEAYRELKTLGRDLPECSDPFPRLTHSRAVSMLHSLSVEVEEASEIPWEGERVLSGLFRSPFFITDYPLGSRGFYDREDPERPGVLRDFDLVYPEGFGEAASGAEREYEYDRVLARLKASGEDPEEYGWYLSMLQDGIEPTAGFGIGIERLTRFLCGLGSVWEARFCPKVPGVYSP